MVETLPDQGPGEQQGGQHRSQHRHRHGQSETAQGVAPFQSLNDIANNTSCRIRRLHTKGAIRQRLLDLGLVPGVAVTMIRCAPLADPLEVRIGDSFITLRRAEAAQIEVTDV